LADERGHPLRRALRTPVAVGISVAPPVELALLGQSKGVAIAGSHGYEPPLRLRQDFDTPGQHLALQRAVAEPAFPAEPKGKDRAGVGHRQGEAFAKGDAHHAILREGVDQLRSRLRLGFCIKLVAQTARYFELF